MSKPLIGTAEKESGNRQADNPAPRDRDNEKPYPGI